MLFIKKARIARYTLRVPSPRVSPSNSTSNIEWDNATSYNRKTISRYVHKKIKYSFITITGGLTIAILIVIAILVPLMSTSKSTTTSSSTSASSVTTITSIVVTPTNAITNTLLTTTTHSMATSTTSKITPTSTTSETTTTTESTRTTITSESTTMTTTSETTTTTQSTTTLTSSQTTTTTITTTSETTTTTESTRTSSTSESTTTITTSATTSTTQSTTTSTSSQTTTTTITTTSETTTTTESTRTSTTSESTTTITTSETTSTTQSTTTSTTSQTTTTTASTSTSTTSETTTTSESTTTTTTSTTSTSTVTPISLRWNTTGQTVAGQLTMISVNPNYLDFPIGIILDSSDSLYVADYYNEQVQQFSSGNTTGRIVAGNPSGMSGSGANILRNPSDVAVDSNHNVYVADSYNCRVQLWRVNATSGITVAGTGTAGNSTTQLDTPRAIAFDSSTSTLYVSDGNNHRVMKYTLNSTVGTVVAGGNGAGLNNTQLYSPKGLYFDSNTNSLVICNTGANNVVRWVIGALTWTLVAGNINGIAGNDSMSLNGSFDVTLDPMGNVYVADRYNQRVQFFRAGEMNGTTIAGQSGVLGASSVLLQEPLSVAFDSQLNLYVSDSTNNRIQKFSRY